MTGQLERTRRSPLDLFSLFKVVKFPKLSCRVKFSDNGVPDILGKGYTTCPTAVIIYILERVSSKWAFGLQPSLFKIRIVSDYFYT